MIRLNKRGQSASNETTGWLLALVVLIVVALVVWGIFSYLKSGTKLAPDQLTVASSYCEHSTYSTDVSAYCGSDYKEFKIKGKPAYYTCYDIGLQISPAPEWLNTSANCSITPDSIKISAASKCNSLNKTGDVAEYGTIYISDYICNVTGVNGAKIA
jgi:hypothetical protein